MSKYLTLQDGNAGIIRSLSLWLSRFHAAAMVSSGVSLPSVRNEEVDVLQEKWLM